MKRSILTTGGSLLAVVAILALVAAERKSASAEPPARAEGQFLEVGKSYTFGWTGTTSAEHCKVLEAPRGNWVKVSIPVEGRESPLITWVNIIRYAAIVPE